MSGAFGPTAFAGGEYLFLDMTIYLQGDIWKRSEVAIGMVTLH